MSNSQKAQKYLILAHAGGVLMLLAGAAFVVDVPDFFLGLLTGMLMAIVILLFRSSMRDEYIERLWNAGTALAFLATLVATLGVELARGFADQQADVFSGPPLLSIPLVGVIALAAFFAGFHLQMLRSRG